MRPATQPPANFFPGANETTAPAAMVKNF
jgi:hypothetical protein